MEEYDDAFELMKKIGKSDDMRFGYAEWPLFNNFRKTQSFKDIYKEIYGCDYEYNDSQPKKWEDIIQEAVDTIKESKEKQAKVQKDEKRGC